MMGYRHVVILLVTIAVVRLSEGYKEGPPLTACKSMYPTGHDAYEQNTTAPYIIQAGNCYSPERSITVEMKCNDNVEYFEGLFIQARCVSCDTPEETIGSFSSLDSNMKYLDCGGKTASAVSHSKEEHYTSKKVKWTAPSGFTGQVYFRGTFVEHKDTFWVDVRSTSLSYQETCAGCCVTSSIGLALAACFLAIFS